MSKRELDRVEVLARVRSEQLLLVDAGRLMGVSYRQAKRLWKRYREEGAAGLQHRNAGRPSNRAHKEKFRRQVLRRVREKYGGAVGERFGPTLDVGGGVMESRTEAASASASTPAQGALWGTGAVGREFSRLAGGAWSGGLFDRHGG